MKEREREREEWEGGEKEKKRGRLVTLREGRVQIERGRDGTVMGEGELCE